MTAEIAILNKSAVALAADSAVTIGRPPSAKVYNTVNKIFEISPHVGLMVYGRLDFMGLPFETIIKEYRKSFAGRTLSTIKEHGEAFRHYLVKSVPLTDKDRLQNIDITINSHFAEAYQKYDRQVRDDIATRGTFQRSKLSGIFQTLIRAEIHKTQSVSFSVGFARKALPQNYSGLIDQLAENHFSGVTLSEASRTLIRQWSGYLLSKEGLSAYRSGIVVAGFGSSGWCPSLVSFETDGIVDNRLKYVEKPDVDIGRHGPEAEILGFAQDDMMKSFVEGIDPTIRKYLFTSVKQGIMDTAKAVLSAVFSDSAKEDAAFKAMESTLETMQEEAVAEGSRYVKRIAENPIRDMISAMPKQELVRLAESLIDITSLKRKVTRGQETVGGDVDVAIISKSEGFVWTKRKHYFLPELNPRFFNRQHGTGGANA